MTNVRLVIAFIWAISSATNSYAQIAPIPFVDGLRHTGVPSCSTAGCHGDQVTGEGVGPIVGQNEYFQWASRDEKGAHSRAYEVLLTPHGKRIAANLGLGPAHKSDTCLDCHADNVAEEYRSQRFQISDGVGCEACHGGAENWLAFHRIGAGHARNIEAGLYPTEDPASRARLCFGCHIGSAYENQFVSHRLMGAGHPRMKFELDLYTTIQKHHVVDEDYRTRKAVTSGAQVWAIGQAIAVERTLTLLIDNNIGSTGAFPEFVFFDCHSCHQPISEGINQLSWRPNPGRALGPGAPILNDANIIMLQAAMRVIDPVLAAKLENQARALHAASQQSGSHFRRAAATLKTTAEQAADHLSEVDLSDPAKVRAILREITSDDRVRRYTNYAAAEQALFAVQRLTAALGLADSEFNAGIERAGQAAKSPYGYDQRAFGAALRDIGRLAAE